MSRWITRNQWPAVSSHRTAIRRHAKDGTTIAASSHPSLRSRCSVHKSDSLPGALSIMSLLLFSALPAVGRADASGWDLSPSVSANYDWLRVDEDSRPFVDQTDFRRARLGFVLKGGDGWMLRAEHDLENRTAPELSLQWQSENGHRWRFGQYKHPFLLDDVINERQTPLMEEALSSVYAINRRLGVEYAHLSSVQAMHVSLYGKRLDGTAEGLGLAARFARVLRRSEQGLWHLGASLAIDDPRNDQARYSVRPEAGIADRRLADTGTFDDVKQNQRFAIEALWLHGAWSVQAEQAIGRVTRDGSDSFDSRSSYALLSWSPTGHQRSYKQGIVGSPEFSAGERPWELFLRYSDIDLDDGAVLGGQQHDWTAGATWYVSSSVRLLGNITRANSLRRGVADAPTLYQFRIQWAF